MTDDDDLYGDDEFGFDDFDDDFDDLDDFDDDLDASAPPPASQDPSAYADYGRVEQTFLQKYFWGIVVLIAVSLGSLWFLGQMLTTPKTQPTATQQEQTAQNNQGESDTLITSDNELPMPVPLNSFTEEELPVYKHRERTVPPKNEEMYDPGVLTPLPGGVGTGYDGMSSQQQIAQIEDENAQVAVGSLPVEIAEEHNEEEHSEEDDFDSLFSDNPGLNLSVKKSDLEDEQKKPSVLDTVESLLDGKPLPKEEQPQNNISDIGAIKAELAAVDSLTKKLETTDTRIEELMQVIHALEEKVDRLDRAAQTSKSRRPSPAATTAAPAKQTTKTTTTVAAAPQKATPRKRTTSWQLRSAQTGKAVVARKGTNDFRTIEVGSSLSGIGRIKSIMIEDGRWVVRGSQGKIVQ